MQKQKAFTLIELMITVAIVGILAAIALPSYQDSVRKSRRADVKVVMLGLANAMERRFTETNSYLGLAVGPANTGTPSIYTIPAETATYYTVTIINPTTASSYTLSAVPAGTQANEKCGTLTLTNTGVKTNSAGLDQSVCW
jgi:type IV pilus assembly protein PilE